MKKIKLTKKNLILFAVLAATAIAIVVLDQITKMMAVRAYEDGKLPVTVIKGVLSISYLENLGGAFGGMAGRHVLFFVLTVLALPAFCVLIFSEETRAMRDALPLR